MHTRYDVDYILNLSLLIRVLLIDVLIFTGICCFAHGFDEVAIKEGLRSLPAAVKESISTSDGELANRRYLPERGGGDFAEKPLLGRKRERKRSIQYPVRGGYTGDLTSPKVRIGTSIYSENGETSQKKVFVKERRDVEYKENRTSDYTDEYMNFDYDLAVNLTEMNMTYTDYVDYVYRNTTEGNSTNRYESRQKKIFKNKMLKLQSLSKLKNESAYESSYPEDHEWKVAYGIGLKNKKTYVPKHNLEKSAEHRLVEYLFETYNKHVRPSIYGGEPSNIFFELSLFDILDMASFF